MGLAVSGGSDAKMSGDIWEDGDPDFNDFIYRYKTNHGHVALKGKILTRPLPMQAYVSGSVGVGFNRAHDFIIMQKVVEQLPPPEFQSHTTTAFTYTLGAGLQRAMGEHWRAGVGYEFADWGKSRLSRGVAQTLGTGLQLSHLYTHQLQLSISFIA